MLSSVVRAVPEITATPSTAECPVAAVAGRMDELVVAFEADELSARGQELYRRMERNEVVVLAMHAESDLGALLQVALVLDELAVGHESVDPDDGVQRERERLYERFYAALHSVADRLAHHAGDGAESPAIDRYRSPRLSPHARLLDA